MNSRAEALACIPVKYPDVRETLLDSGEMILGWREQYRPFFRRIRKFMGSSGRDGYDRKLQLDLLGVQVWRLMDGRNSVHDIIGVFADEHRLHRREAEMSVSSFIRSLGRKGLVSLRHPD